MTTQPAPPPQTRKTHPLNTPTHLLSQFSSPLASRLYSRQYAALYDFRLRKLRRSRLVEKAKARWEEDAPSTQDSLDSTPTPTPTPTPTYTPRILDVKTGQATYVTGIVYVEMKLKPDVLADLTREQYLPPLPPVTSYVDPTSDTIYVEDESGRLKLVGDILRAENAHWITGTVGAFLGTELENGDFHVLDVCWPGVAPSEQGGSGKGNVNKRIKVDDHTHEEDQYVLLLSGLDLGSSEHIDADSDDGQLAFAAAELRLALLTEWVGGEIGSEKDRHTASHLSGLLIAGNILTSVEKSNASLFNEVPTSSRKIPTSSRKIPTSTRATATLTPTPPSILLSHLLPLSSSLPIVIQPGASDPVSAALPQQAIHRAILRGSDVWTGEPQHAGISLYNNPSWVQFGDTTILSTAGQSVDDLAKYVPVKEGDTPDRISLAESLLRYGHIAPTCPDTLWCYPFTDRDPFIIGSDEQSTVPDLLVIGNQPEFATSVYTEGSHSVRVVLLPPFSTTGQVALVNLRTKDVHTVSIGWDL